MGDDGTTPPGYAWDPVLALLWGAPPAFTGNTGASAGTGSTAAPDHNAFTVDLATVQAAESTMLGSVSAVIDAYNPLDGQVAAAIGGGTVFGQQATYTATYLNPALDGDPHPQVGPNAGHEFTDADVQLQQGAQQFAATINPSMTRVLRMIADAAEATGVFIAALDKAGQGYTAADVHSVFPAPGTTPTA